MVRQFGSTAVGESPSSSDKDWRSPWQRDHLRETRSTDGETEAKSCCSPSFLTFSVHFMGPPDSGLDQGHPARDVTATALQSTGCSAGRGSSAHRLREPRAAEGTPPAAPGSGLSMGGHTANGVDNRSLRMPTCEKNLFTGVSTGQEKSAVTSINRVQRNTNLCTNPISKS